MRAEAAAVIATATFCDEATLLIPCNNPFGLKPGEAVQATVSCGQWSKNFSIPPNATTIYIPADAIPSDEDGGEILSNGDGKIFTVWIGRKGGSESERISLGNIRITQ